MRGELPERQRPILLHISGDFPDAFSNEKTSAFQRLFSLTGDQFDHRVVSINRVTPGGRQLVAMAGGDGVIQAMQRSEGMVAIEYIAPPLGILHQTRLLNLADRVSAIDWNGPAPAMVVGHKLTVEGIVAERVAQKLGCPYGLTIQGNTDAKILSARRDLRPAFRRIYKGAAFVTSLAPWSIEKVDRILGRRALAPSAIPCPISDEFRTMAPRAEQTGFITAFNLADYANKNLAGLVRALAMLEDDGLAQPLAVAGGGSARDWRMVQSLSKGAENVELLGTLEPVDLALRMSGSVAMILPSRRESFGMVFIEALRSGCPVIYPKGAAIDGYFDGAPFAIAVDARNPSLIADAMQHAVREQTTIKAALADAQASGALDRFSDDAIARDYGAAVQSGLAEALPG